LEKRFPGFFVLKEDRSLVDSHDTEEKGVQDEENTFVYQDTGEKLEKMVNKRTTVSL